MYLDVKTRLSNKFWACHLVDSVAIWLKSNRNTTFPGGNRQSGSYPETGFAEINGDFLEDDFCCSSRSSDCLHGSGQRQTQVLRIEGDTISWRAFLKATAFRERTGIDDIKTELIQ